jgi:multiple antibiotic resistance protein
MQAVLPKNYSMQLFGIAEFPPTSAQVFPGWARADRPVARQIAADPLRRIRQGVRLISRGVHATAHILLWLRATEPALLTSPATAAEAAFHSSYVRFSLLALSSIFFLVDPFAAIPSFIAITSGVDPARRRRMAWKAGTTCFIVLTSFALAGKFIFSLFGIKLPAFEIAGGLILMLIGIDMLEAKRSPTQESIDEAQEGAAKEDAGIVPLGIPMLAGPGAISSVMVLVGEVASHWEMLAILGSIAITAAVSFVVLNAADRLRRFLGETGIRILVRIMGLLLVALAMQFFVNGLTDLGVIPRHQ